MEFWRISFMVFLLVSIIFTKFMFNYIFRYFYFYRPKFMGPPVPRMKSSKNGSLYDPVGYPTPPIKDGEEGNRVLLWMLRIFFFAFLLLLLYDYHLNG